MRVMANLLTDRVVPVNLTGRFDDPLWQVNPVIPMSRLLADLARAMSSSRARASSPARTSK